MGYNTTGGRNPPNSALTAFTDPTQNAAFTVPQSQAVQHPAVPLPAGQASGEGLGPMSTSAMGGPPGLVNQADPLSSLLQGMNGQQDAFSRFMSQMPSTSNSPFQNGQLGGPPGQEGAPGGGAVGDGSGFGGGQSGFGSISMMGQSPFGGALKSSSVANAPGHAPAGGLSGGGAVAGGLYKGRGAFGRG